ncbi:MAG: hypothetical protein JNJ99_11175 [Crocinitomicaceae bacterium]|nr:hypothetical protein [Crocinitomicaceae bacterium]
MNSLKSILFITAGLIIFLHALVPHDHHQSDTGRPYIQSEQISIFEQIALGFHLSQDETHLNDFTPDQPIVQITPELVAVLSTFVFPRLISEKITFPAFEVPVVFSDKNQYLSSFSHRGPPVI